MKMKLFFFASLLYASFGFSQEMPVLVELYTSQGCSSCPPADALLEDVANRYGDNVIVMAYHVDYWDYIGWKDPFASKQFTEKQRAFARMNNSRNVYTPQAVVNQRVHFTGSNSSKMDYYLKKFSAMDSEVHLNIDKIERVGNSISGSFTTDHSLSNITYTYAVTVAERTTAIKRGENRNKTLRDTHIVASVVSTNNENASQSIQLMLPDWVKNDDSLTLILYATTANEGVVGVKRRVIN